MTNNTADAINMTVLSDTDLLNTTQMDAKTSWLTTSFAKLMHSAVSTTTSEPLHNVNHTTIDVLQDVHNTTILTISSTSAPLSPEENSPVAVFFVSCVFFIVAVALVLKVVLANRKKRTNLIGGSARWRLAASQQSGAGPVRTAASYVPMSNRERPAVGGLDSVGPVENMDWERQFFDDTEPTVNVTI